MLHGDKIVLDSLEENYNSISHVNKNFPISIRKNKELSYEDHDGPTDVIEYCVPKKYSKTELRSLGKLKVGVANIKITDDDFDSSYKNGKKPNLSHERHKELFSLLNQAKKKNCDIFVLPEASIPYRWLPFFVKYARNHQWH